MSSSNIKDNLKKFQILYDSQYIKIYPLINNFKTQIIINKRTAAVQFQNLQIDFKFKNDSTMKLVSFILGVIEVQQQQFLVYSEKVYPEPPILPYNDSIYQLATIQFLSFGTSVSKQSKEILQTIQKHIMNFSFYFSIDRDLTHNLQNIYTKDISKPREKFYWNHNMLKSFEGSEHSKEWCIPIIQGHYSYFNVQMNSVIIHYYLISRRSKYRSGMRFYNRGIDENSRCANFVQTEQLMLIGNRLSSIVMLSGSPPIFWQQKSQNSIIRLTRSKQLTSIPFTKHLKSIKNEFYRVLIINLLEKKKPQQNILLQAFQQIYQEMEKYISSFSRYYYFDINDINSINQIAKVIEKLSLVLKCFGKFVIDIDKNEIYSRQTGVLRINCLDCLNRTNRMQQAFSLYFLNEELSSVNIYMGTLTKILSDLFENSSSNKIIIRMYKNLWTEKADFESLIYTGSRAVNNRKNIFLDSLDVSIISIERLYNQKFEDRIKQIALDTLLYYKNFQFNVDFKNYQIKTLNVCLMTWNVNATLPENLLDCQLVINNCRGCDIAIFGIQEMIDLNANNVMNDNCQDSIFSTNWGKFLEKKLGSGYLFLQKCQMVGIFLIIFIKEQLKFAIKSVHKDLVKTGAGGFGNKGAVIIRTKINQTSICFICAHLTAGQGKCKQRVEDFVNIHQKAFQQQKKGTQNEMQVQFSDYKFFFGDLNFRIEDQFATVKQYLQKIEKLPKSEQISSLQSLIEKDQLTQLTKREDIPFVLSAYNEPPITFLPSYKLQKKTGQYTFQLNRTPSWCDRILYWTQGSSYQRCQNLLYSDVSAKGSDHKPVIAKYQINILNNINRTSTDMVRLSQDL